MKRIVLVFGLISGVMLSAMLVVSMALGVQMGVGGMIIGYTTMLIASLLVYFGIRSYRDNVGSGTVGFGRALQIGLLISLISTVCYVVSWEIVYRTMLPDFADKYAAATLKSEREKGSSPERIAKVEQSMAEFREQYAKPYIRAAYTFLEPLPVALLVSLVSAGVLSRGRTSRNAGGTAPASA